MSERKLGIIATCMSLGLIMFQWHLKLPDVIQAWVFLPWLGYGLLIIGITAFLKNKEKLDFGSNYIKIPLILIATSIIFSGVEAYLEHRFIYQELIGAIAIGIMLLGTYIVSRKLGNKIFKYMPYAVIIESISIPIVGAFNNWQPNGGLLSWTNYDIATGFLIFGVLVSPIKWQWWLSAIALVGLLFSGSGEAIFVMIILAIILLARCDWSWKLALPVGVLAIALVITFSTGIIYKFQEPMLGRITLADAQAKGTITETNSGDYIIKQNQFLAGNGGNYSILDRLTGFRVTHSRLTMPIKPFGYGINLTHFYWGIPHNVILIIIEQVGILAAILWLWVTFRQTFKSPMKYALISLFVLGLLDHFVFTQAAPIWWAAIGVSSTSTLKNDYIFKGG